MHSKMKWTTTAGLLIALVVTACTTRSARVPSIDHTSDPWLMGRGAPWSPAGFPTGGRIAVLHGNPADTGYFVLRLSLPDNFAIPPHWHPTTEIVTVLRGTFHIGMGERADRGQTRALVEGSVGVAPARMAHFAWTQGNTVVQVHGSGPFTLNLVTPPR